MDPRQESSSDETRANSPAEFSWDDPGRWYWTASGRKSQAFATYDECLADWCSQ